MEELGGCLAHRRLIGVYAVPPPPPPFARVPFEVAAIEEFNQETQVRYYPSSELTLAIRLASVPPSPQSRIIRLRYTAPPHEAVV